MNVIRVMKKFNTILSRHQKIRIVELVILMIIGGLLETLSVSLILPFMDIIMNPEKTMRNDFVKFFCTMFNIQSSRTFLMIVAIALAILYFFKNIYLLLEYNVQFRFVFKNMFDMQKKLLGSIISRNYEYFLSINSAEVIRIVNGDTANAFNLLSALLMLFTEFFVSGMLIIAVFIITPGITLIIAVILILMMLLISAIIKPILQDAGVAYQNSLAGMNKWLLQSIQGIKEVKISNKEEFFKDKYGSYGKEFVHSLKVKNVLGIAPRFLIEAIGMCAMFIAITIFVYQGVELEGIVPTLSAVAIAAIRLLPSVNRISSCLSSIMYEEPMLDKLMLNLEDAGKHGGLKDKYNLRENTEGRILTLNSDIIASNIYYKYPQGDNYVLKDVNLKISRGDSVGIIGTSGAGKSTIVDILLGLLEPQQGSVKIDGINIKGDPVGWSRQIGYIPQTIFMLDDSIRSNIAFGESEISDEDIWRALSEAQLEEFVKSLHEGIDTQIGERGVRLSGGQRQRIGIARALYLNPQILVFDEATSALDTETENDVMDSINDLMGERTIIIITHRLSTIEKCKHIYRVDNKKIEIVR